MAAPAAPLSGRAQAGEEGSGSAFRLYFTLPFVATRDPRPARLGFQLLSETHDEGAPASPLRLDAYSPLRPDPAPRTVLDLAFSRNGIERFEVHGADMRGAYAMFTRGIGLRPEAMAFCRETACLAPGESRRPRPGGE